MEDKVKKMMITCADNLTAKERKELVEELEKYDSLQWISEQKSYSDTLNKSLGPMMGNRCVVCGK